MLAEGALHMMGSNKAVLLANHGVLTVGNTVSEAFNVAESVEFCAELYCKAKSMGEPGEIADHEMDALIVRLREYRQPND